MGKTLPIAHAPHVDKAHIKRLLMHCKSKQLHISMHLSLDCRKILNEASAYMHGIKARTGGPLVPPQTLLGC